MKASKKPATANSVKDLPVEKLQDVKGGIIIDFAEPQTTERAIIIDYRTDRKTY